MAPERFDGRYSSVANVYGAGVVLYRMIVGDVPFLGSDPYQLVAKSMHGDVSFATLMRRRVSRLLRFLVDRMLDKVPDPHHHPTDFQGTACSRTCRTTTLCCTRRR